MDKEQALTLLDHLLTQYGRGTRPQEAATIIGVQYSECLWALDKFGRDWHEARAARR